MRRDGQAEQRTRRPSGCPDLSRNRCGDLAPAGVVSTSLPSAPLTVSTFPFGATVSPSGVFSAPPEVTTKPVPALLSPERRVRDRGDPVTQAVRDVEGAAGVQAHPGRPDDQGGGVGPLA